MRRPYFRRHPLAIVATVAALCLTIATLWVAVGLHSQRAYEDDFDVSGADQAVARRETLRWSGWTVLEAGRGDSRRCALGLAPGGRGIVNYWFSFDPAESVALTLAIRNDDAVGTRVVLQPTDDRLREIAVPPTTGSPVARRIDLVPLLKGAHNFHLTIDSTRRPGGNAAPLPVLTQVRVDFATASPPPVRAAGLLFFGALCFTAWTLVLVFLLPRCAGAIRVLLALMRHARPGRERWAAWIAAALALAALASVVARPAWRDIKPHDDVWALANARLLALRHFHTDEIFFRSRVRPGFLALVLPLETLLGHETTAATYVNSDDRQRLFILSDRTWRPFGEAKFAEATLLGLVLALCGAGISATFFLRFDPGRRGAWRAALALAFSLLYLSRIMSVSVFNPISLSATWAFLLAAGAGFAWATGTNACARWAAAGAVMSVAILFKESALVVVLPVGAYQLWQLWTEPARRPLLLRNIILYWAIAAAAPVAYYGLIIDGGFREIFADFGDHLESRPMAPIYETRSLGGVTNALLGAFGGGLAAALAGLVWLARRRAKPRNAAAWCAVWTASCCAPFFLPYFYPRFLIYMIPPMAWLSAAGVVWLASAVGVNTRRT